MLLAQMLGIGMGMSMLLTMCSLRALGCADAKKRSPHQLAVGMQLSICRWNHWNRSRRQLVDICRHRLQVPPRATLEH